MTEMAEPYASRRVTMSAVEGKKPGGCRYQLLPCFIVSSIQESTDQERGTGLEQGLKLAGSVTVVYALLFAGFLASNGLI
jgi:hypothetical protein